MHLAELYVHPLKSGRGVRHGRAFAGQAGLLGDRSWMLTTPQGEFITARSHPMLTQVRVTMIPGALLRSPASSRWDAMAESKPACLLG